MGEKMMTDSVRNFIIFEVNRNERSPRWGVATIEVAENRVESAANLENDTEEETRKKERSAKIPKSLASRDVKD